MILLYYDDSTINDPTVYSYTTMILLWTILLYNYDLTINDPTIYSYTAMIFLLMTLLYNYDSIILLILWSY